MKAIPYILTGLVALFTVCSGSVRADELDLVVANDADADGMPDAWELAVGLDPTDSLDAALDPDSDNLTNLDEYRFDTYPMNPDTDGDGLLDGWEIAYGFDPRSGMLPSLVGWWRFDDNDTLAVADHSGFGNTANLLAPEHLLYVGGAPVGGALRFDGTADPLYTGANGGYVCVPGLTDTPFDEPFTVAAWVRADSFPAGAAVLSKAGDHDAWLDGFSLFFGESLSFCVGSREEDNVAASGVADLNAWLHLCGVYDGSTSLLYVNGFLAGVVSNVPAQAANSAPFWIGTTYASGQSLWHGDLADVRVYTTALATNTIDSLLEPYLDPDCDGLCNLDEQFYRTNPLDPDTDHDGMPDGWEIQHGFDPLNPADALADADGDGLTNVREYELDADPRRVDTDGDGLPDAWEGVYRLKMRLNDAHENPDNDDADNLKEFKQGRDPRAGVRADFNGCLSLSVMTPLE